MGFAELFLIAVGLSMDAFAVSICKGLNMKRINYIQGFITALFFGVFQALMPIIGYLVSHKFEQYITNFDHWIAFILLGFIGGKMIFEALNPDDNDIMQGFGLDIKELFLMAIATSIDALMIGITFAFLNVNIISSSILIGCTTFVISFAGVVIGNVFGSKYKEKAEFVGGLILILIGIKVLIEHLGLLNTLF